MPTVLLRADGSHALGMGHIMRCSALASSFTEAGWTTIPAWGPYESDPTIQLAAESRVDAIVLDLSHRENAADPKRLGGYVSVLRGTKCHLVLIDGAKDESISSKIDLDVDMVILPYVAAEKPHNFSTKSIFLLGTQYAIYRPEFAAAAERRQIADEVRSILVTMGGSDPFGLTLRTLAALKQLNLHGTTVSVVEGPSFSESAKAAARKAAEGIQAELRFVYSPPNLAQELVNADLAIINDGLTKYEAAVTGTPSIVLSQDQHQRNLSKDFSALGCYAPFGPEKIEDSQELAKLIDSVKGDLPLRKRMSEIGRQKFDARGGARVVRQIEKELLHVQKN